MRISVIVAAVAIFFPVAAQAQPVLLTLEDATRLALEQNINVIQSGNNVEAAKSQTLAAYGNYLPSVSASGGWGRTQSQRTNEFTQVIDGNPVSRTESTFGVTNSWSTGVSANLTLFDGFAREAQLSSAKSRELGSEMTSIRTRQSIVFAVTSGYLNVLRNRELVRVSEENLRRDQRQLERIVESNRVGALSLADVYRQQSQVASDELDLITVQNTYENSKADLVALIGLDASKEFDFVDPSVRAQVDTALANATLAKYRDFQALRKSALEHRPDYVAVAKSLESAESGVTIAKSGYIPSVGASGSYGNGSNELDMLSLNHNYSLRWGVDLRWNLFDGFATNQQVQTAKVSQRNSEIALAQAEKDIGVEVKKAMLDLEASRKAWDVSDKALISASEDRKIAEERYNLGAGTLLDLLVANASYVRAEATRVNAIIGFHTAKYNMEYVVGERTY